MGRHNTNRDQPRMIAEIRSRQSNILWPDTLKNSTAVNRLLWKGTSDPTLVQRIGMCLFGLAFFALGAVFLPIARTETALANIFLGVGCSIGLLAVGLRLILNGLRRHSRQTIKK